MTNPATCPTEQEKAAAAKRAVAFVKALMAKRAAAQSKPAA